MANEGNSCGFNDEKSEICAPILSECSSAIVPDASYSNSQCWAGLESLSNYSLIDILQYLGSPNIARLTVICQAWNHRFSAADKELWLAIAAHFKVEFRVVWGIKELRCTNNYRREFFRAYAAKIRSLQEKHDALIIRAKSLLQGNSDSHAKLKRMIDSSFRNIEDFDYNWRCSTMEDNTLLSLACRYSHPKCAALMLEHYRANVNLGDVGGFTPLIFCAYHGNFAMVLHVLRLGADVLAAGRLRSGPLLIAEHWAAIQGHFEICRFLHALRVGPVQRTAQPSSISVAITTASESSTYVQQIDVDGAPVAADRRSEVTECSSFHTPQQAKPSHSWRSIKSPATNLTEADRDSLAENRTWILSHPTGLSSLSLPASVSIALSAEDSSASSESVHRHPVTTEALPAAGTHRANRSCTDGREVLKPKAIRLGETSKRGRYVTSISAPSRKEEDFVALQSLMRATAQLASSSSSTSSSSSSSSLSPSSPSSSSSSLLLKLFCQSPGHGDRHNGVAVPPLLSVRNIPTFTAAVHTFGRCWILVLRTC